MKAKSKTPQYDRHEQKTNEFVLKLNKNIQKRRISSCQPNNSCSGGMKKCGIRLTSTSNPSEVANQYHGNFFIEFIVFAVNSYDSYGSSVSFNGVEPLLMYSDIEL